MAYEEYMRILKLDEAELQSRLAFFELTEKDFQRLRSLSDFAAQHENDVVEGLYELFLGHAQSRGFFPDDHAVQRVKALQRQYFRGLFSSAGDLEYVRDRLRVGAAHERIGLSPKLYIGGYGRYLRLLYDRLLQHYPDPAQAHAAYESLLKLVCFDISLAIDTYIAAQIASLSRHQAAIRELSTPVIRVHDRILLLPIVGSVDSLRAKQIMETVLTRVTEEQAQVLILDIAGVPVVDTKVADHLLQTTAAVRLLGATTILTGIGAQVARTIVQLGVDISSMHTRSRLADGIDLALGLVGKRIVAREA